MYKEILLVTMTAMLSSFNIKAETPPSFRHEFSLGVESIRYFYKEPDVYQSYINALDRQLGAVWMNHTGNLYGLNGSYRLTWKDTLFIQPEGRFLWGTHDYRAGRKEKINGKTKNKISVLLYEPRLIVGGHLPIMNKLIISPYTGIGYRFKSDDSEKVKYIDLRPNIRRIDNDVLGSYRKSNYVYIPFGTYVDYAINDTWSVSLKGEYDCMVKGWQYTRRLNQTPIRADEQPNGYGLKGEVSVSYLYQKVNFSVSPYINYWNIRNSKDKNERGMEPYNVTFESGMRLGVTF